MRRLECVEIEGEIDAYMSLVAWGWLRRWLSARKAWRMGIQKMFMPKYGLAVFRGHPKRTLPNRPDLVFHLRDKSSALKAYHKVAETLTEGGCFGDPVRALFDANQQELWRVHRQ